MNKRFIFCSLTCFLLLVICSFHAAAQVKLKKNNSGSTTTTSPLQYDAQGRLLPPTQGPKQDSLKHRDYNEDSITIYFRYFDSTRIRHFDSSISDFLIRYPVPAHFVTLGNLGAAAHSLLFKPNLKPGFDAGFHAFDLYRFKIEDTRFFQTTRPFTDLGYLIGGRGEQVINVIHTQNIKPNFNMAAQFRLINSPGVFQNQNSNHSAIRLNGNFQSRNKRYAAYAIFLSNRLQASENGGIQNDSLMNDYRYANRFIIPTRLSGSAALTQNPFNTRVVTGNVYRENTLLFRQQYDFGQNDSIVVNDSNVIRLFYPRFRLQHTLIYSRQQYEFRDFFRGANKVSDYQKYFHATVVADSLLYRDKWKDVINDFSIISFPEKNNLNQFIKAGIALQNLTGTLFPLIKLDYNLYATGEYRNRTRNQKWDVEAIGKLYLRGLNGGDYSAQINLKRVLNKKLGFLEVGFQNVNRTPSFIFNSRSTFPVTVDGSLSKENISRFSGSVMNDAKVFALGADYYIVSNYTYFNNFFTATQEGTLFNVLHIWGKKSFKLKRFLTLYAEAHVQKTAGNPPLNLPLIFTSNRIAYENTFYRNLVLATGFEVRYHSPYKADNYSPFSGQFFYQDSYTISNRPEVNAFFNFRIKRFSAYLRFENLNTLGKNTGNIGFNKNNLAAEHYPQQGLWIRLGIWWTFIN